MLFGCRTTKAQSNVSERPTGKNVGISIGYPGDIFDNPNVGVHVAINPRWSLNNYFWIEMQIMAAYAEYNRDSRLFSHDGGYQITTGVVGGLLFYMLPDSRDVRPYLNFLVGIGNRTDVEYNSLEELNYTTYNPFSFSTGLYAELYDQYYFGISFEGPYLYPVIRVGYNFYVL